MWGCPNARKPPVFQPGGFPVRLRWERWSVDHSVTGPQLHDLVLQLELSSLQFRNLEVVRGRMGDRVLDFTLERLVSPFKLAQMHLQRHVPVSYACSDSPPLCHRSTPDGKPKS